MDIINWSGGRGVPPASSKQLYNDLTVNIFKIILLHEHRISVPFMPSIREGELPAPHLRFIILHCLPLRVLLYLVILFKYLLKIIFLHLLYSNWPVIVGSDSHRLDYYVTPFETQLSSPPFEVNHVFATTTSCNCQFSIPSSEYYLNVF